MGGFFCGSPARARTWDPLLRRQMLYPTELRNRFPYGLQIYNPTLNIPSLAPFFFIFI